MYVGGGLYEELNPNGSVACRYTPGISETRGGVSTFYHHDLQGSTVMVSRSDATTGHYAYDAWGNVDGREFAAKLALRERLGDGNTASARPDLRAVRVK